MTKKCELTIVNENMLTVFHTIFPLNHFFFHFLFYSLLVVIVTPYLSISVSYFGCLKHRVEFSILACYNHAFLCNIFHEYTSTNIFGHPYFFDVSEHFPLKIRSTPDVAGWSLLLKPKIDCQKIRFAPYYP